MSLIHSITTVQSSSLLTPSKTLQLCVCPITAVKPRVSFAQYVNPIKPIKIEQIRPTPLTAASNGGAQGGAREHKWTLEGVVTESLPNGMFKVRVGNGDVILGTVSGKIRTNHIRIVIGDKVMIEVSRYDSARGRITFRLDREKNAKREKKGKK